MWDIHDWTVPKETCLGEIEYRYGIRKCIHCGREEHLILGRDGTTVWRCYDDTLKGLDKLLK